MTPERPPRNIGSEPNEPSDSPLAQWLETRLVGHWGMALLIAAGLAVFWPSLTAPFALDDDVQAAMVHGTFPVPRAPYDLYNFIDDESRPVQLARGLLPWWTNPQLTVHFFRPLASALRWADYTILGESAALHHAHSFLWWLAAVFGARVLFRRLIGGRAALIATVVFALAPAHAIPLSWLANREALVSLAFGIPALLAYMRWRDDRTMTSFASAAALFTCALAAGEYSVALLGYVAAFEVMRPGESLWRRLTGALCVAVPTALYLGVRAALGCGAVGSGVYVDPLADTADFLAAAPYRLAHLLLEGWFGLGRESFVSDVWPWGLFGSLLVGGLLVAAALWPVYRALPDGRRRVVVWLLLGGTLSVAPMLAAAPTTRLLGVLMVGVAPIVGLVLDHAWFKRSAALPARGLVAVAVLALAFVQLVRGPASAWRSARGFAAVATGSADRRDTLRQRLASVADAELVVVRGNGQVPFHLPFALDAEGHVPPASLSVLAHTNHALAIRRGPRTLELIGARDGALIPFGEANLFVDLRQTFSVGQTFTLPHARATVLEVAFGRPRIVSFEFDHDLDHSPLTWVTETDRAFVDAPSPPVGRGVPHTF